MASTTSFPSSWPLPGTPCFFPGVALAISSSLITLYKPIWNLLATNDGPFSFHNLCQWVFSRTPHSQFRSLDVKNIRLNSWHLTHMYETKKMTIWYGLQPTTKRLQSYDNSIDLAVIERCAEEPWCTLLALNFDAELVTDQAATPAHISWILGRKTGFKGSRLVAVFDTQEFYF